MIYSVRVNGKTLHNNPNEPDSYVPNEPPIFPVTLFNYVGFCLREEVIRIGWPDTGDLNKPSKTGALAKRYSLDSVKPYIQEYLLTFRDISVGSVILMPNTDKKGDFYMGEVTKPYHYRHNVPTEPYECAHRLGVEWDRDADGKHKIYHAAAFGIETRGGGFWRRAFQALDNYENSKPIIPLLLQARKDK